MDINVNDAAMEEIVKELLTLRGVSHETVRLHRIPTNDAWCRDPGIDVRDTTDDTIPLKSRQDAVFGIDPIL